MDHKLRLLATTLFQQAELLDRSGWATQAKRARREAGQLSLYAALEERAEC